MFKITHGKGFHMTFENGWTVSVQWGMGNYGNYYDEEVDGMGSTTAEIAAWDIDGNWYQMSEYDIVKGHVSANDVLAFMAKIAAL
jgi:hypothetical protein